VGEGTSSELLPQPTAPHWPAGSRRANPRLRPPRSTAGASCALAGGPPPARPHIRCAEQNQLGAVGSALERAHGLLVDPDGIARHELEDVVVEPEPRGAAQQDVDLLLLRVAMAERHAEPGCEPR
jgi:hypothetical protein